MVRAHSRKSTREKRGARRAKRRAQSRQEILDAARRVVERDGVGMTLDAVADEVGLTKPTLYHYFASKDEILLELMLRALVAEASELSEAIARARSGADALAAIVRTTITRQSKNMDDFRFVFVHGPIAGAKVRATPEFFARLRPLNDLVYGAAAKKLGGPHARRTAFLAHLAAIGVLTMKSLVESFGDPLVYTDEELVLALERIFRKSPTR
jgi:AcrR family transcriptional regulator